MTSLAWIGEPVPRVDGVAKVSGKLLFPSDVCAEGMLHCCPVLAPHPHAKLLAIHTERALGLPEVVRVLTHEDVPGPNRYGYRRDHPVLCDEKTRCFGDMVAVVVAETEGAAEAGARAVEMDYEPLPLVSDPEQALTDGTVSLHGSSNVLHQIHYRAGDTAAVLARPDVVVVEQTFRTQRMDHAFLETEGGIAFAEDGGVRVIAGGQNIYYDRQQVAQCLALPLDKVRMIEPYTGGAFGGKGDITVQIVVALAALLTGKPCRMVWTREEHFLAGVKRHPYTIWARSAAARDGTLLALESRIISDTGAYAVYGDSILELTVENITGPYRIPNVTIDAWAVYTNNPVCGAFRGYGATQGCFAIEGQMSELARRLGLDEIDFRRRNALKQGDRSATGHELFWPVGIDATLEVAGQHPLWCGRKAGSSLQGAVRWGVGMALGMKGYGLGLGDMPDYASADIELAPDGKFNLGVGIIELGQGSFTVLTQMAAEVLHCSPELVAVQAADTGRNTDSGTTAASRVTYAVGRAVVAASQDLAQQICATAATGLHVSVDQVELISGTVRNLQSGATLALADVAKMAPAPLRANSSLRVPFSELPTSGALAHPHVLYSSNLQIAQVAVDTETGEVNVERVAVFPEVGRVINRLGLEGQCEGGVAQGVGYALMEQVMVKDARILNPDLTTYPIPTVADVPVVETVPVEVPESTGPFGAKGAAENATLPTAPAILDAIADAIGVRFTTMPVTPERVVDALAASAARVE